MQSIRLLPETLRTLAYTGISGSYATVGTPLSNPSQIYLVQNLTNALVTFSMDGTHDHFVVPSQGFILIDAGANKGLQNTLSFHAGVQLYAKGSPGSGSVYLSTFYMG